MGWGMGSEERDDEVEPDPRESPYELPPLMRPPLADADEKAQAVRRVIEQAEKERASDA
jgi:hypothetical protein